MQRYNNNVENTNVSITGFSVRVIRFFVKKIVKSSNVSYFCKDICYYAIGVYIILIMKSKQMNMKRRQTDVVMLLSLLFVMLMASCTSYKKVPYLQNSKEFEPSGQQAKLYEPIIQPQDMLTITVVNSQDPQTAMSYNLVMPVDKNMVGSLTTQPALQNYIVDTEGCVDIPNVGKVHIAGMTLPAAEDLILSKVEGAFAVPPTVTIRFVDYNISVLGEVTAPGTYTIKDGKVNILEALALAKDLTVYGVRENVKIVREDANGAKSVHEVNLNDASLLNSPYYYLQQNDVVYVTPNKSKAKNSDIGSSTSLWFSGTSIAISLVSLLINILN